MPKLGKFYKFSFVYFLLMLISFPVFSDAGFPGREKYPDIPFISLDDFHEAYKNDQYTVVDARSNFEFNVIQVKGALNLPLNDALFTNKIHDIADKTGKTIVFYCNGRRCMKSYKAAIKSNLEKVLVFDAGIFEWSQAYPDDTTFLGKSPMNPDDLISTSKLKEHIIPLDEFESLIMDSVLIDVRTLDMRRGSGLFLLADRSVPLDNKKKLERYLQKAIDEDKILLAYDNAGKTIRWLQYHLENKGIKRYYFMKGGAKYYTYDNQ
ncbi:rhodanese-like domain-containing protein [sulfur-oxidizing endosymbiont of Gigantopelta aegis]|uniref:rhodanese-like domain-containing protein n=1 Tax=sulfur-oxidizing endosymbiont of Gigantopelta aegis TaxID=2794934 RepID=UPI0018DEAEF7|nr:rhodanese-like domain-containing protein [sulfur-oxidizing endosymbiont of Gigantopelta aegis]